MKTSPFNLEKALASAPIVTRDGRKIHHIIKAIDDSAKLYRVIAISYYDEEGDDKGEGLLPFSIYTGLDGKDYEDIESMDDLIMLEPDEVKTTGLTFGEALVALKDAKFITRASWKNKRIYVYLTDCLFGADEELRVVTVQGKNCPWMPNHQELLAEDWEIV